jgi:hypothetical protein
MTNKKHKCAKCKSDLATADAPAEATGLFVGKFWNEYSQRIMPYRGWLCDFHADQAESGAFVKSNKETQS